MTIHTIHDNQFNSQDVLNFISNYKVTSFLTIMMVFICIVFNFNREFLYQLTSYNLVVQHILSSFVHVNLMHLVGNLLSLLTFRRIEKNEGQQEYIYKIIYFVVMNALLIETLNRFYTTNLMIGYSGVLFGFATLYPRNNIFGYECDKRYYPFILLLVMQVIVFNASFIGHLTGILSAYIYIGVKNMHN